MTRYICRGAFLLFMALVFVSCAPNRAMTKSSDGMTGHQDSQPAVQAKADNTYADDDDFDIEENDLEKNEPKVSAPQRPVKKSVAKTVPPKEEDLDLDEDTEAEKGKSQAQTLKGNASWYGREFHGKKTASGERFDMNKLTAAHKTLPLGTEVLVKNLDNGKTVKVRINDRGPFKKGRIIDLSFSAAKKLGMVAAGEVPVSITVLGKGKNAALDEDEEFDADIDTPSLKKGKVKGASYTEPSAPTFGLQTGAFLSKKNAEKLKVRLEEFFPDKEVVMIHEGDLYKVKVTGIASRKEAENRRKTLAAEKIESFVVDKE